MYNIKKYMCYCNTYLLQTVFIFMYSLRSEIRKQFGLEYASEELLSMRYTCLCYGMVTRYLDIFFSIYKHHCLQGWTLNFISITQLVD